MISELESATVLPMPCPPGQPIPVEPNDGEPLEAFAVRRATMTALGYFDQQIGGTRLMRVSRVGHVLTVTFEAVP